MNRPIIVRTNKITFGGFMKKIISLLVLSLPVLGLFSFRNYPFPNPDMFQYQINIMQKELGLSLEQTKKIEEIMNLEIKNMELKRISLEKEFLNLREELLKDNPDLEKIKSIIEKKSALEAEMEFNAIKRDLDIKPILTKEQFDKLSKVRNFRVQSI